MANQRGFASSSWKFEGDTGASNRRRRRSRKADPLGGVSTTGIHQERENIRSLHVLVTHRFEAPSQNSEKTGWATGTKQRDP